MQARLPLPMAQADKVVDHIDQLSGDRNGKNGKPGYGGSKRFARDDGGDQENGQPDINVQRVSRQIHRLFDGELNALDR